MTENANVIKTIKEESVEYVDIRFTDPRGKLQHVTVMADQVDEDFLEEGFMFDGSSIAGWKSIDQSDMKLMPDSSSFYVDPFYAEKTLAIHCSVVEPDTGQYLVRQQSNEWLKFFRHKKGQHKKRNYQALISYLIGLWISSLQWTTRQT